MDGPVEAPGTPVASSGRGMDGLSDITVPAKAAMLEARVAELEVCIKRELPVCSSLQSC